MPQINALNFQNSHGGHNLVQNELKIYKQRDLEIEKYKDKLLPRISYKFDPNELDYYLQEQQYQKLNKTANYIDGMT